MDKHDAIWLQWDPEGEQPPGYEYPELEGATWCQDQINDNDWKYLRATPAREVSPDLLEALQALGVIGGGYCFCHKFRDPFKDGHEPECRDARAAIKKATE